MYSLAFIFSQGCRCRSGVKCLWECELMRGPPPWVLFYIPFMWNIWAMQVMKHESTDNTEDIIFFTRKYKTLQKINSWKCHGKKLNSINSHFLCSYDLLILSKKFQIKKKCCFKNTKTNIEYNTMRIIYTYLGFLFFELFNHVNKGKELYLNWRCTCWMREKNVYMYTHSH